MVKNSLYIITTIVLSTAGLNWGADNMPWPVDAPPALTSTFGEYRPGHFHSGIDLKTYGKVGLPCRAIVDGSVIRVKLSPGGYGKALYLKLNDGRIAVYAHLDDFTPELNEIIHREQDRNKSYSLDLSLDDQETVAFRRGEIVAFSGRSGVKHPHVHFEIRSNMNEVVNPLLNDFDVADNHPPVPVAFSISPLDGNSTVEGDHQPRIYSRLVMHHDGVYRTGEPIGINGRVGISIDTYDRANNSENLLAVYKIELVVNEETIWNTTFDRFWDFQQGGFP